MLKHIAVKRSMPTELVEIICTQTGRLTLELLPKAGRIAPRGELTAEVRQRLHPYHPEFFYGASHFRPRRQRILPRQ